MIVGEGLGCECRFPRPAAVAAAVHDPERLLHGMPSVVPVPDSFEQRTPGG
jgi:hypothetical protein